MPTFHLLFALVAYAGNFTHVRCESPAIRYEHLVDRTVHIVNFDVARSLKCSLNVKNEIRGTE